MRRISPLLCVLLVGALLGSARRAEACTQDTKVEWNYLFADQGTMYDSDPEPTALSPVTLTLRTCREDITGADIEYYDTADRSSHRIPMHRMSSDPTGTFEYWQ